MKDELLDWMEKNAPQWILDKYRAREESWFDSRVSTNQQLAEKEAESLQMRGALEKIIEYSLPCSGDDAAEIEVARKALSATPETAKLQAVLDAAEEWESLYKDIAPEEIESSGHLVKVIKLIKAVREWKEQP